jgi:glucokinase
MEARCAGIEIGGTKLQVVLGDAEGCIAERRRMGVEPARGAAAIREGIAAALAELLAGARPAGVGAGFGGPVDRSTGRVTRSHQIEGWAGFEVRSWLEELTGAPVVVDNDCNVAALGEALRGAGAAYGKVFYVTLGSGVGGGMVLDGEIYHGAPPGEAEVGLNYYAKDGTTVESRCSGWAVDAKVRAYAAGHPDSPLARLVGTDTRGEARHLGPALKQGDAAAAAILRDTAEDLAYGLSHAVHMFNPEAIVLGGGLALLGEPLRAAVADSLPGFLTPVYRPGPDVRLSALGADAVCVGALLLAGRASALER